MVKPSDLLCDESLHGLADVILMCLMTTFFISMTLDGKYIKYIKDLFPSFNTLDDSAKMIWLMSCEDTDIIQKLADFVYKCFSLRYIR